MKKYTKDDYLNIALERQTTPVSELSKKYGVSRQNIYFYTRKILREKGLAQSLKPFEQKTARNEAITRDFYYLTTKGLAKKYGMSAQRCSQIVLKTAPKLGIDFKDVINKRMKERLNSVEDRWKSRAVTIKRVHLSLQDAPTTERICKQCNACLPLCHFVSWKRKNTGETEYSRLCKFCHRKNIFDGFLRRVEEQKVKELLEKIEQQDSNDTISQPKDAPVIENNIL